MKLNLITAVLLAADVAAIKGAITTIESKLPFLLSLTPEDRQRLFKLGPKSLAFVENSLLAARNNPQILPSGFSVEDFETDVQAMQQLNDIRIALQQLFSKVDDTFMAVGSEAITNGTEVYNYVKTAAKRQPGLKPVADQLGERFVKSPKAQKKAA